MLICVGYTIVFLVLMMIARMAVNCFTWLVYGKQCVIYIMHAWCTQSCIPVESTSDTPVIFVVLGNSGISWMNEWILGVHNKLKWAARGVAEVL